MSTTTRSFYLFLDFDGVLHHVGDSPRLFEHADRLGALLKNHPNIRVVISSSWREIHRLDELRDFSGSALGDRIIDATPVFRRRVAAGKPRLRLRGGGHAPLLKFAIESSRPFHERFEEIAAWLVFCAPDASPLNRHPIDRQDWIALDDTDFWFPPRCLQLIQVTGGTGLLDQHFEELDARLQAARERNLHVP